MIKLEDSTGVAMVDLYGAQVMSYVPTGGSEVLWRTGDGFLQKAKASGGAMRGGIPVCWPWFGPRVGAPQHGVARLKTWEMEEREADFVRLGLMWEKVRAQVEVRLGGGLEVRLTTLNESEQVFELTQGLHTYVRVGDVGKVRLDGLQGTFNAKGKIAHEPFVFDGELDEVYAPVKGTICVVDEALGRVVKVENSGCEEAFIWNPGLDKADMVAGAYKEMVCVEAVNVRKVVRLAAGQSYTLVTKICVE